MFFFNLWRGTHTHTRTQTDTAANTKTSASVMWSPNHKLHVVPNSAVPLHWATTADDASGIGLFRLEDQPAVHYSSPVRNAPERAPASGTWLSVLSNGSDVVDADRQNESTTREFASPASHRQVIVNIDTDNSGLSEQPSISGTEVGNWCWRRPPYHSVLTRLGWRLLDLIQL